MGSVFDYYAFQYAYWPTAICLWIVINCLPQWIIIYKYRNLKPEASRDEGFSAFVRNDYSQWSYLKTVFTHFMFIPRFIIGWGACFVFGLGGCYLVTIGHKRGTRMAQWRSALVSFCL